MTSQKPAESLTAVRREAGRKGADASDESPKRRTIYDLAKEQKAHYNDVVVPAAGASYQLTTSLILAIEDGIGEAAPEQIRRALAVPADPWIDTYTRQYRDDLEAVCNEHGIDPLTGEPLEKLPQSRQGHAFRTAMHTKWCA